jgi:hypothetical protein
VVLLKSTSGESKPDGGSKDPELKHIPAGA